VRSGGLLTIVDILKDHRHPPKHLLLALRALECCGRLARALKEFICEARAIPALTALLEHSRSRGLSSACGHLMFELACGNPRFEADIRMFLLSLLGANAKTMVEGKQVALATLQSLLALPGSPTHPPADSFYVEAVLALLCVPHAALAEQTAHFALALAQRLEPSRQALLSALREHLRALPCPLLDGSSEADAAHAEAAYANDASDFPARRVSRAGQPGSKAVKGSERPFASEKTALGHSKEKSADGLQATASHDLPGDEDGDFSNALHLAESQSDPSTVSGLQVKLFSSCHVVASRCE
jgi:hypothetical protein